MNPVNNQPNQMILIVDAELKKGPTKAFQVIEKVRNVFEKAQSTGKTTYLWAFGSNRQFKRITQIDEINSEITLLFKPEIQSDDTLIKRGALSSLRILADHLRQQPAQRVFDMAGIVSKNFNPGIVLNTPSLLNYDFRLELQYI